MNTFQRLLQFLCIYTGFLLFLWAVKYALGLSDYLIPPPAELVRETALQGPDYGLAVLNTFAVSVAGHILAIFLALAIAVLATLHSWIGTATKTASYNLQAYPIVAVAPIIFLFFGDGLASRLLIAAMICYFPLLLTFIGIFSVPVEDVEHFFRSTGRMSRTLELRIRAYENLEKILTVLAGSATLAMVGTIVAEFLAATSGIGYNIRKALYQSNLARILVALFLIGLVTSLYLALIEKAGAWLKGILHKE